MSELNVLHVVCSELKEEYQAGLEDGIVIQTYNAKKIIAHEVVLAFVSKYFRTLIKNLRASKGTNGKVVIDYKLYPYEVVKVS